MDSSSLRVGWTPSPNGRGTSDILWSCFTTLIACTWTILHLNIHTSANIQARWTAWFYWQVRLRKIGVVVTMVMAPEFMISLALRYWLYLRASVREMRSLGVTRNEWSMIHAFYANRGSYALNSKATSTALGSLVHQMKRILTAPHDHHLMVMKHFTLHLRQQKRISYWT